MELNQPHNSESSGTLLNAFSPNSFVDEDAGGLRDKYREGLSLDEELIKIETSVTNSPGRRVQPQAAPHKHGPLPVTLEIETENGEHFALQSKSFTVVQGVNGDLSFSNEGQPEAWAASVVVNPNKVRMDIRFKVSYLGLSAEDALVITRFSQALSEGGTFRIIGKILNTDIDIPIVTGSIPAGGYPGPEERWIKTIERLALIESKTGVRITIPEAEITVDDLRNIANTAHVLKTGHATYNAEPWTSVSNREQASAALESFANGEPVQMALHYDEQEVVILGARVPLGPVTLFCDRSVITEEDIKTLRSDIESKTPDAQFTIRYTPLENCPIEARYIKWLPEDEAAVLRTYPMFQKKPGDMPTSNSGEPKAGATAVDETTANDLAAKAEEPLMTEDEFERYLVAKGIIAPVPSPADEDADDDDWEPVMVTGKPLSEMVIEERR